MSIRRAVVAVAFFGVAFGAIPGAARADQWESNVDGRGAYDQVKAILDYKRNQANKVEEIFFGLRDKLYVVSPTPYTTYTNNYLTPNSVTYTVTVRASYDMGAVGALYSALKASQADYFRQGENEVVIKFPQGEVKLKIYDEIMPTYQRLIRGGYAFEARAVLLDKEQTVIASSDNSLLLSTPELSNGLDFSTSPLLRTYQKVEAPDLSSLMSSQEGDAQKADADKLRKYLSEPAYRLQFSDKASFFSLPIEELKKVSACRVLRDSDELLVYKRDAK